MGIYSSSHTVITEECELVQDMDALKEQIIYAELACLSESEVKKFLASEDCKALEEAGIIGRKTIVRLSRQDDLTRRTKIAAFQLAKEKNDPLWDRLVKNRIIEKQLIAKLKQKYGTGAKRSAITAQKALIKDVPNIFTRPIGR